MLSCRKYITYYLTAHDLLNKLMITGDTITKSCITLNVVLYDLTTSIIHICQERWERPSCHQITVISVWFVKFSWLWCSADFSVIHHNFQRSLNMRSPSKFQTLHNCIRERKKVGFKNHSNYLFWVCTIDVFLQIIGLWKSSFGNDFGSACRCYQCSYQLLPQSVIRQEKERKNFP